MIIKNKNLSSEGVIITPRPFTHVLPAFGLNLCTPELLLKSPPPAIIGEIPDMRLFSRGSDIDVGGLVIKNPSSDIVAVPKELGTFYNVLSACVSNEYLCDPNVRDNWFILTITRCDVEPGKSNRHLAEHWHRHTPSVRSDRYARLKVVRNYTVADNGGTEFLTGTVANLNKENSNALPTCVARNGVISALTSFSLHRTAILQAGGRRTVLIFISYAKSAEGPSFSSPALDRLHRSSNRDALVADWRARERALFRNMAPIIPHTRMCQPGLIEFARAA